MGVVNTRAKIGPSAGTGNSRTVGIVTGGITIIDVVISDRLFVATVSSVVVTNITCTRRPPSSNPQQPSQIRRRK
jgi:hypothetical protein